MEEDEGKKLGFGDNGEDCKWPCDDRCCIGDGLDIAWKVPPASWRRDDGNGDVILDQV